MSGGRMRPLRRGNIPRRPVLAAGRPDSMRGLRGALAAGGAGGLPDPFPGGEGMTLLRMAASYRHSGDLIRVRIIALKDAAKTAPPEEKIQLERRIKDLNTLYRETRETALVLERYYDRRCRRNGRR